MMTYRIVSGVGEGMQSAALFAAVGAYFFHRRALALGCHLGRPDQIDALVASAYEEFGRVDIVVNNAAMSPGTLLHESSAELFQKTYATNTLGPMLLALRAVADEVGEKAASHRQREGLEPALIPERVMVCMSSSADAPRVIRIGSRIAGRLGARWYAVYVETPREAPGRITYGDRDALQRNISLAESLGATVVRVKADRPADGLIEFAKREGITHVIFGQTARSRWEILLKGSTLNRFLEEVRDATIQVVPLGDATG